MTRTASILMTREEICGEFGWSDDMVRRLLHVPDAPASIRGKNKSDRYGRDRVLAAAQTTEGRAAKKEWDETVRSATPNPGWTTRLRDIGRPLGISAIAVGRILELLGYRFQGCVTESAVRAGCGIRRWDGFTLFCDWHLDRVLGAIRLAAKDRHTSAVATALAEATAKQNARDWEAARKRTREETEATRRQEEEARISVLEIELRALRATDTDIELLTAVEYITSDLAMRIVLYKRCHVENPSNGSSSMRQDDLGVSTVARSATKDLALLERRARCEGFPV